MSEDSAHGQHYEPSNGAATGPQVQQAGAIPDRIPTIEQALDSQLKRVQQLATRVGTMLDSTTEAFQDFVMETAILFQTLESFAREKEQHDNRPTDRPPTQTSA